jgi:hypothetical protein
MAGLSESRETEDAVVASARSIFLPARRSSFHIQTLVKMRTRNFNKTKAPGAKRRRPRELTLTFDACTRKRFRDFFIFFAIKTAHGAVSFAVLFLAASRRSRVMTFAELKSPRHLILAALYGNPPRLDERQSVGQRCLGLQKRRLTMNAVMLLAGSRRMD